MQRVLVVADLEVRVSTDVDGLLERLERVFGEPRPRATSRRIALEVRREAGGAFSFTNGDDVNRVGLSEMDLLPYVEGLVYAEVTETPGRAALHAGCVTRGGVTLLFVGPSNAGKSSLCRAALAQGYRYLADDLTLFDGRGLLGLSRSIAFDAIDAESEPPAWVRDTDVTTYRAVSDGRAIAIPLLTVSPERRVDEWTPASTAHVVIPTRVVGETTLEEVDAADALSALLASAHHPDPPDLGPLTQQQAYRLDWASPDEAIALLSRTLRVPT